MDSTSSCCYPEAWRRSYTPGIQALYYKPGPCRPDGRCASSCTRPREACGRSFWSKRDNLSCVRQLQPWHRRSNQGRRSSLGRQCATSLSKFCHCATCQARKQAGTTGVQLRELLPRRYPQLLTDLLPLPLQVERHYLVGELYPTHPGSSPGGVVGNSFQPTFRRLARKGTGRRLCPSRRRSFETRRRSRSPTLLP